MGIGPEYGHSQLPDGVWTWDSRVPAGASIPYPLASDQLLDKKAVVVEVSEELLSDLGGCYDSDLIGKVFRGEIKLKPLPPPKRHRCLACWLVSLTPGHARCEHGYLRCDDCRSDY